MRIRPAQPEDAAGMARVLAAIAAQTGSARPTGADHVRAHYLDHIDRLACTVAVDAGGAVLGFQSLKRAVPGNLYDVPPGWGIIGTHVSPMAARQGVGRALFAASRAAALAAGLTRIDATISRGNLTAQAYYDALGFRTWRETDSAICKMYDPGV